MASLLAQRILNDNYEKFTINYFEKCMGSEKYFGDTQPQGK